MSDVFSREKRSELMSHIRGKNTKPEIIVRQFLFSKGLRYRLHSNKLPGRPDIVLPKYKTVIFVHGCFWHNHDGCKNARLPKTRKEYWEKKINANVERDKSNISILVSKMWKVQIIWECQLNPKNKQLTLLSLYQVVTACH